MRTERQTEIESLTKDGSINIMAQEFVPAKEKPKDKRILFFDGKIWAAYERHAPENDFRSNVAVGGTYHPAEVSEKEKQMASDLIPYFKKEGLVFVGIDVLEEKLIEINVTCSAGLCECKKLYPDLDLAGQWAEYLESKA